MEDGRDWGKRDGKGKSSGVRAGKKARWKMEEGRTENQRLRNRRIKNGKR
jgi:hypothetical protein